jgi:hypothetical protein
VKGKLINRILKQNSLYEMRYKRNEANKDWQIFLNILSKQRNVTFLELEGNKVQKFPDTPEKWDLKKLQKLFLQKLKFPVPAAFQNFTRFIKTLDKITDLNLDVMEDKTENKNDYTEMLLFSLSSLKTLHFENTKEQETGKIGNLCVSNSKVENLTMFGIPSENCLGQFVKIFPNVRKAKLVF